MPASSSSGPQPARWSRATDLEGNLYRRLPAWSAGIRGPRQPHHRPARMSEPPKPATASRSGTRRAPRWWATTSATAATASSSMTSRRNVFRGNRFETCASPSTTCTPTTARISGNVSFGNHVGYAIMYSHRLVVRGQLVGRRPRPWPAVQLRQQLADRGQCRPGPTAADAVAAPRTAADADS